eukprot:9478035-Pyramimonas_sp.AAC.1
MEGPAPPEGLLAGPAGGHLPDADGWAGVGPPISDDEDGWAGVDVPISDDDGWAGVSVPISDDGWAAEGVPISDGGGSCAFERVDVFADGLAAHAIECAASQKKRSYIFR